LRLFDRFDVFILKNIRGNVVDSICLATGYRETDQLFVKYLVGSQKTRSSRSVNKTMPIHQMASKAE